MDEVGALNHLTAEEFLRGVSHVKSASVFTLRRLIGDPQGDPVWPVRSLDENGVGVPVGQLGEFATSGPRVVPGYWNKPEATTESLPESELRISDAGFVDDDGWFYLVARKKDMINASGYKLWPRKVEDVPYGHPAIREVAVIGVPDEYRGETIKANVSCKPDSTVTGEELIEFCKRKMTAYKYPGTIKFLDDSPKTMTGKTLRRELRALNS